MDIILRPVDRNNWRTMVRLQLKPEQTAFVSPPAWSLARCYVRCFGDQFEHLPHLIYSGEEAIGYSTIACNPGSHHDYWIDDIMIDARHQCQGYGRAAVTATIRMILSRYPRCLGVQLTCFRANHIAARLYLSLGFVETGRQDEEFGEPTYRLSGSKLDVLRLP